MCPDVRDKWRCTRDILKELIRYRTGGLSFRNINVFPTQVLVPAKSLNIYRGGPDWPFFDVQTVARQCRGPLPMPVDRRPDRSELPVARAEAGLWCGPLTAHYGHMIADFGMRIAASSLIDRTTPLVFSVKPGLPPPPSFFWEILRHFGISPERVHLVSQPTVYERLRVLPQAERLGGGGPRRAHLDLMETFSGPRLPPEHAVVYVSRATRPHGRIAGEAILSAALAEQGVTVFDPETVGVAEQLALYRRARHIVFAEGSALHSLQLIGRLNARVTVLARRPWARLAAVSLAPRVRALHYVHAVRGTVHGLRPTGAAQVAAGISILDEDRLLTGLARAGIPLARHWDSQSFARSCAADVAAWVERRHADLRHGKEGAYIEERLRAVAIRI